MQERLGCARRALNRFTLHTFMQTLIFSIVIFFLWAMSLCGIAYYLLAVFAVRKKYHERQSTAFDQHDFPSLSILKPLCGIDPELESNLETFFLQDYPYFEILFAVRDGTDPSVPLVQELMKRYPTIPCSLVVTGDSPYPNAKVYSLERMAGISMYEILTVTDSDVSVAPNYLKMIARYFVSKEVGLVTNLYRGVGGKDLWSKLEALGMSTEFMAGVVVAEFLEGMRFSLGPSMAISSKCLQTIGGFASLSDYLADDFVLGAKAFQAGYTVVLSTHVIDHHAYSTGFLRSFKHRLRWNRSTRFSRPAGYIGQGFAYGLPWAILLSFVTQTASGAMLLLASSLVRGCLAYLLGKQLLEDSAVVSRLWLVPLQDCISFVTWIGGFLGNKVLWRNISYQILPGGRFVKIQETRERVELL